jgi:nicotinate-nucleotide pyrophosphorylase (carboxylating)
MFEIGLRVRSLIERALDEDLAHGDVTTSSVVDPLLEGRALLLAKEDLVLAGIGVFAEVFRALSEKILCRPAFRDGDRIREGEVVCTIEGPICPILSAERTALNIIQRMSGIATLTSRYVEKVGPYKTRILDTRKTAPGLRILDKYAVRMGGGRNHRFGLSDGVLIKDNHIAAAGGIGEAISRARKNIPHTLAIEVEVEDLEGLKEAIEAGADAVLLDNMELSSVRRAVEIAAGRVHLEVSGGVNLSNVEAIAATGVDMISVGALTHSAKAADLSLEVVPLSGRL